MNSKKILFICLVSVFFTLLSLLYKNLDFSQIHSTWDLIIIDLPQVKVIILDNEVFRQIPMLPVLIGWIIIGIIAYLIYFSVQLTYNNIRNWTVIELFFQKAKIKEKFDFWHFAVRTIIHIAVIISYLIFLVLVIYVLYKSSAIYSLRLISSESSNVNLINLLLNGFAVFLVWLLFFSFFAFLFYLLNRLMVIEEFEEEHGAIG